MTSVCAIALPFGAGWAILGAGAKQYWEDFMRATLSIGIFVGLAALPVAAWSDAALETVAAQTHATLAAEGSDIAGVHMHLHHAINCLVGPGGRGYDAKQMN